MSRQIKPEYFSNSIRNRFFFFEYLYGSLAGFIYGAAMAMSSIKGRSFKSVFVKLVLWSCALVDDITGAPINRSRFEALALASEAFK